MGLINFISPYETLQDSNTNHDQKIEQVDRATENGRHRYDSDASHGYLISMTTLSPSSALTHGRKNDSSPTEIGRDGGTHGTCY